MTAIFAALSSALAATGGDAASKPGLADAVAKTTHAASVRYAIHVRMARGGSPLALHVHGQASKQTISVRMKMDDLRMPDGTKVPGPEAAALLDGPFLYERAPSTIVVLGKIRWLRLPVASLSPASAELKAVHALSPTPLLHVLSEAHMRPVGERLFRGTVAYDDPIVRASLNRLTGGIEFRQLRVSAYVGRDGLLHRLLVTGWTADGRTSLALSARLFAFGRPVHVTPPKPGTFMDEQLAQLSS